LKARGYLLARAERAKSGDLSRRCSRQTRQRPGTCQPPLTERPLRHSDNSAERAGNQEVQTWRPDLDSKKSAPPGGSGEKLMPELRAFFEPRLDADLDNVRLHTEPTASASARALDARA
jgi:hypothetical protein